MSKRTRVYITMPERSLVRSTDRGYLYDRLTRLSLRYPVEFVANTSLTSRLANDLDLAFQRGLGFIGQVPAPGVEHVLAHVPFPRDIDVAYAYGTFPRAPPRRVPITWQQTFAPPSLGVDLPAWRDATRKARRHAVARADRIVVPSAVSLAHLHDLFPAARERASILPYYLPGLEPLSAEDLAAKSAEPGPLRVLFVGKEARRKGLPALVAAWQLLDTNTKEALDVTVVSAMVDGEVACPPAWHRTTFVDDLYALMGRAHVLVFPTLREAYGLVLVEAMARGLAIVTTTAPIQRDIVGEGGRFVAPTDAAALAATLTRLANDRAEVAAMAAANVTRFRATLWHEVVGPAHVAVFTYP